MKPKHILEGEILPPSDGRFTILGSSHPLRNSIRTTSLPSGLSIREALDVILADDPARKTIKMRAWIGEHVIPEENWSKVRPKPGVTVVFRPVVQGGNFLKDVLGLALAVAALFIAPLIGPAIATALGVSTSIGISLAGAAITIGGSLLLNALFPTRPPQLSPTTGEVKTRPSIAGAQNQLSPWSPIPSVLGKHRLSPYMAAKPYTENHGADQYLHLLFVWGYGRLAISDLRIGDTALTSFDDYEIQTIEGASGDNATSLFPAQVFEDALDIELKSVDSWQTRTLHADADVLTLNFTAPNGIFAYNTSTGVYGAYTVVIRSQYRLSGGTTWSDFPDVTFTRAKQTVRKGTRVEVARGTYEVRTKKVTTDADSDTTQDHVYWTAAKTFTNSQPINFPYPLAITALRIKATNQLNGVLDTFNGIVQSYVTAWNGSAWVADQLSQNPADLFRHVLTNPANGRPVSTAKIDLAKLQDWWTYCDTRGLTFNMVRTDASSVYDTLADIAAAGRASVSFIDGKWGVVFNQSDDDIVWAFTPRNSFGFSSQRIYRNLPHALRVRFINATRDYAEDERVVYNDGYDGSNATVFESVEFPGVTNPDNIYKDARFQLAQAKLRPETYKLSCDWEGLRLTRGDRVSVTHDVPLWGTGFGRVEAVAVSNETITLDSIVTMESDAAYAIRFWVSPGEWLVRNVINIPGETDVVQLESSGSLPEVGDLFAFGELDHETVTLRVMDVRRGENETAELTLVDDAPGIFDADTGEIPAYDPGITAPPDPYDLPPTSLQAIEQIAGFGINAKSYMHLSWTVPRQGTIRAFEIQAKDVDTDGDWTTIVTVAAPQLTADVFDLEAGIWQFRVRCLFSDSNRASNWTTSDQTTLDSLLDPPEDVSNLQVRALQDLMTLAWDPVTNANLAYYQVRYNTSTDGAATWGSSTIVVERADSTTIQVPTRAGSYLVKAITFQGIESSNPALVTTTIAGSLTQNVVDTLVEEPTFSGVKDGTEVSSSRLRLSGDALLSDWVPMSAILSMSAGIGLVTGGYYYFASGVDLGAVYTSRISATIAAVGDDISNTMSLWTTLATVPFLDNSDASDWQVTVQYRTTDDNPLGSPVVWSDWLTLISSDVTARAFEFRAFLQGTHTITPSVSVLEAQVDMPDRVEAGNDVVISASGTRISFDPPFKSIDTRGGIAIAAQNLATGDYPLITSKDETGFTIRFFNSAGVGVSRTIDYVVKGYGRVES